MKRLLVIFFISFMVNNAEAIPAWKLLDSEPDKVLRKYHENVKLIRRMVWKSDTKVC